MLPLFPWPAGAGAGRNYALLRDPAALSTFGSFQGEPVLRQALADYSRDSGPVPHRRPDFVFKQISERLNQLKLGHLPAVRRVQTLRQQPLQAAAYIEKLQPPVANTYALAITIDTTNRCCTIHCHRRGKLIQWLINTEGEEMVI